MILWLNLKVSTLCCKKQHECVRNCLNIGLFTKLIKHMLMFGKNGMVIAVRYKLFWYNKGITTMIPSKLPGSGAIVKRA